MDSENTFWAVFKTTVGSWSYIEFDYPTVYIYVRIQNLQEVRWAHQLNYKIAHLQLSIINFVGVIILPTPIPLFFFPLLGLTIWASREPKIPLPKNLQHMEWFLETCRC